jgi:phenylpropionate dioxygenase-like ring-hydroxylating dioxygenase large terminal subunit
MTTIDTLLPFWHPVAWSHELDRAPRASVLLERRIVVWRDETGAVRCFLDRCPHRGTALSLGTIEGGCLVCPYHGWTYDTDGACTHIPQFAPGTPVPSRARAQTFACEERSGIVWVCLADEPVAPIPAFPEWDDPAYRHVPCETYTWKTGAPRMVENFTDFGHLGYLHDGLLGNKDDLVVPSHTVEQRGLELRYELTMQVPNTNDEFAVTDVGGERGRQRNLYVLTLPHTIWLQCTYLDSGSHRTLFFAVQPHSETESTGFCVQSRDFEHDLPDEPFAVFQEVLAEQDRTVVESQDPLDLPLAPSDELHFAFDRVAIAYRRALAELPSAVHANATVPALTDC